MGAKADYNMRTTLFRHIVLTDTVSIPSHLRNKTWKILSTFPNLEKLEYKATYGSHAQDLYLFPHKSIVFPKLEKLSMNLLDVDDHQEYHIQPDPIDDPQTLFLNHGLIKHYVAALGGPGSLEARKSIGMSIWYQSMNTEFPIPEIGRSFPVLVDFHIRCGAHNGIDISKQVGQTPRKSSETVKVVRFEAVRGGQETAEILAFGLFPRCEHLHIRMMHHQITSTAVGKYAMQRRIPPSGTLTVLLNRSDHDQHVPKPQDVHTLPLALRLARKVSRLCGREIHTHAQLHFGLHWCDS